MLTDTTLTQDLQVEENNPLRAGSQCFLSWSYDLFIYQHILITHLSGVQCEHPIIWCASYDAQLSHPLTHPSSLPVSAVLSKTTARFTVPKIGAVAYFQVAPLTWKSHPRLSENAVQGNVMIPHCKTVAFELTFRVVSIIQTDYYA